MEGGVAWSVYFFQFWPLYIWLSKNALQVFTLHLKCISKRGITHNKGSASEMLSDPLCKDGNGTLPLKS